MVASTATCPECHLGSSVHPQSPLTWGVQNQQGPPSHPGHPEQNVQERRQMVGLPSGEP